MIAYAEHGYAEESGLAHATRGSILDALRGLRRHRWLIVACGLLGSAAGTSVLLLTQPTYTAASAVVLDAQKPRVIDLPSLVSEQNTAPEVAQLRSEVDILRSEDLARAIIVRLGLLRHPAFQQRPSLLNQFVARIKDGARDMISWLAVEFPALRGNAAPAPRDEAALAAAVQTYQQNLMVANDGRSYVIRLEYSSHDPKLAAAILNAHVELYLDNQIRFKQEVGKQASAWLTRELANLQAKLRSSEDAVQQFREDNQIIQSGETTLLAQQLAAVNAQIPAAEAERINAEANLTRARSLFQSGTVETQSDVMGSPLIQQLRQEEAVLLRKNAELRAVFGDEHPSVVRANAELRDLQGSIRLAVGRIVKNLENVVQVDRTTEDQLRARLGELERRAVVASRAESKLRDLQREVSANSSLIEVLLNRFKQVSAQEEIQQPDTRVISAAIAPVSPSFPKLSRNLPIIVAGSLLCGVALAFLKELMRPGFKASHEIELECDLPSLGSVPRLPGAWPRTANPQDMVIDQPRSSFAEAIRYIQHSMQAGSLVPDTTPKTVLVTSSLAHEGKSVFAVSLARSFARSRRKVLLIDCDFHRPSLWRLMGVSGGACLARVLSNEVHWTEAIHKDPKSPVHFMGTDPANAEPQCGILAQAMNSLIQQSRAAYDIVILDLAPITAVSDALILSRWVDATILCRSLGGHAQGNRQDIHQQAVPKRGKAMRRRADASRYATGRLLAGRIRILSQAEPALLRQIGLTPTMRRRGPCW